ncbi:Transposon Tf2-9 poly [Paramuricea clavata]|uniref:Transposon Tf2-9 poly n=1 Tax=Paramuricea clavata TaxID=317549 RepID=A0A7D9HKW1_PARCT|nr:Transposon Tf2-9 poly [Paramuricea clavata]
MQSDVEVILSKYPTVFSGVGKLNNYQLKVHVNPDIPPVAQPPRRVPFHIRKVVDKKITELEDLDIIESVQGPTPWVSPLVAVPKANGEVRVCVDMRRANEAVIRERHPIPTLEETVQALNGATVFSKLDLRWGYHQIELHPDSRGLTTFSTPQGLKRYKRLIFGLSSASEMYQFVIQQVLIGIPGVRNISDDIIVFGTTQAEHDRSLDQTLQRLHANGLTLNKDKCLFSVPELVFFGFKISAAGLSPDDKKVEAIQNAPAPTNAGQVRSFLGLVNYCARFIPNLATISEPLRQLTRMGAKWAWGKPQQLAFNELKYSLTSDCVMAHYNPEAETELRVDASPVGLGAILMQSDGHETRPVAYATLTDVERRYSQTEREALAVVWGCEKFHLYLYGTTFKLFTDHKPLEFIYSPKGKPPPRIERWVLRLQPYRFKVVHMPGKTNPADVLSRLPISGQPTRERNVAEEYINFITEKAVPKAMTLEQISKATQDDVILQRVQQCLLHNHWPDNPDLQRFAKVRDELSASQGLLLRGTRIVVPKCLRHQTLSLAHEGHQGIVRTKQLLRQKVWWPGIDAEVETLVKTCLPCQSTMPPTVPEPLRPSTMPSKPWQSIHIDLCGPFPSGESLLVCVDACSRWPEVEIIRATSSEVIIRRLQKIFATHGLPEQVTSDNGSNLVSREIEDFFSSHGNL